MPPRPPIPFAELQRTLQFGLPSVALAAVVLATGLAAGVLSRLRSRDPLLRWFAVFALLYGLRLFIANDLVAAAAGIGIQGQRTADRIITYSIPIPYVLFLREWFGNGWKKSISIWLWTQVVFAPLAIAVAVIAGYPAPADIVNNVLILAGTSLALLEVWRRSRPEPGAAVLKYSLSVGLVCVLLTNLGFRLAGSSVEPAGFLVLLCGLAYSAAGHAIGREQKLIAVEQELETARRIQTSILPSGLPELNGLRMAARYQPMTAVAGDFYDFLRADERRVTILVADVSGHGVPAALIASMLKSGFAGQSNHARDPAAILAGLNASLAGLLAGQFVTAACVSIDLDARSVTYAGAGHPPSLLWQRRTRQVLELAENGLFLGPFRHARYQNVTAPFQPGDKLLLYTDGIIEATMPDQQPFGGERLKDFIRERQLVEPSLFVDQLFQAVSSPPQEDDLTVVIAQSD
jgi:phosphoserine phosphatase RsbU/P